MQIHFLSLFTNLSLSSQTIPFPDVFLITSDEFVIRCTRQLLYSHMLSWQRLHFTTKSFSLISNQHCPRSERDRKMSLQLERWMERMVMSLEGLTGETEAHNWSFRHTLTPVTTKLIDRWDSTMTKNHVQHNNSRDCPLHDTLLIICSWFVVHGGLEWGIPLKFVFKHVGPFIQIFH